MYRPNVKNFRERRKIKLIPTATVMIMLRWLLFTPYNIVLLPFWTIFWIIFYLYTHTYITFLLNIYGKYTESWQSMWSNHFAWYQRGQRKLRRIENGLWILLVILQISLFIFIFFARVIYQTANSCRVIFFDTYKTYI